MIRCHYDARNYSDLNLETMAKRELHVAKDKGTSSE